MVLVRVGRNWPTGARPVTTADLSGHGRQGFNDHCDGTLLGNAIHVPSVSGTQFQTLRGSQCSIDFLFHDIPVMVTTICGSLNLGLGPIKIWANVVAGIRKAISLPVVRGVQAMCIPK